MLFIYSGQAKKNSKKHFAIIIISTTFAADFNKGVPKLARSRGLHCRG